MNPETFVEHVKALEGLSLRSVVLYGSAAAGDHAGRHSDYNVLVVLDRLGCTELDLLARPTRDWLRAGNPPPLLFTPEGLRRSADVFPIELLDLRDSRKILFGDDPLEGLIVEDAHLRHQLEYELKSKLIRLREDYLVTGGKPARVAALVATSAGTFFVLLRAVLRLFRPEVPARKMEAARALTTFLPYDLEVFEQALALKEGNEKARNTDAAALFARYLAAVEQLTDAVDRHLAAAPATPEKQAGPG